MLAFFRTFVAVVLAIAFCVIVPTLALVAVAVLGDTGPRDDSWLTIRLNGGLLEYYTPPTLSELFDDPRTCLMEVTENLEKAAVDDRITGVIFRLDGFAAGLGKLDEIRAGIRRVRDAGKPVYAHAESFGETALYLASECDSVFLAPNGEVYAFGRAAQIEHLKGTFDLLDVTPNFHAIGAYKSAVELFTRKQSSDEAIENVTWLFDELDSSYVRVLDKNRGLDADDVGDLRARGILRADDALAAGVVDGLLWWDELADHCRGTDKHLASVSSPAYAHVERRAVKLAGRDKIAVVHAQGFVAANGDDRFDTVVGLTLGPDRIVDDLEDAREDDSVKAVILRWDTGGGATVGGDLIAHAVQRLRDEKPVVVSVADVAASAGYTMSFRANRIVCPRNGITGSIGSLTGKLNVRGLYEKLGITHDTIAYAPNALLFSELTDFTPEQWDLVARDHLATYDRWIADIADARGRTPEEIEAVAGGRVWTGGQALERGLVDDLGTFWQALDVARELADLDPDTKVDLVHYPRERSALDLLRSGEIRRLSANEVAHGVRRALTAESLGGIRSLAWEPAVRVH
ncbi:MAG: S49 family peptidase [bacterium]